MSTTTTIHMMVNPKARHGGQAHYATFAIDATNESALVLIDDCSGCAREMHMSIAEARQYYRDRVANGWQARKASSKNIAWAKRYL